MKQLSRTSRGCLVMAISEESGLTVEQVEAMTIGWCKAMNEDYDSALFRLLFNTVTEGMPKKQIQDWLWTGGQG